MKNSPVCILSLLVCLLCLVSCQHHKAARLLSSAESLMWERPDSVLKLLEQIPFPAKLKGNEQADYALLLTQARYRSHILAPSDSLINIAVDYYKDSGEADKKGAAYLYRGGVLNELHETTEAIQAYKQAEEFIPEMEDTQLIACIYSGLGNLNQIKQNFDIAKEYHKKSLEANRKAGNTTGIVDNLINIVTLYTLPDRQFVQDSAGWYASELLKLVPEVKADVQAEIYHSIAVQRMCREEYSEAEEYLKKSQMALNGKLDYRALSVWGELYAQIGHEEKSDSMLQAALKTSDLTVKSNVYSTLYERAEEEGEFEEALGHFENYIVLVDSLRDRSKSMQLREFQLKYDKSLVRDQVDEAHENLYFTLVISCACIVLLISFHFLYKKRQAEKLSREMQAAIRLQEQIDALQMLMEGDRTLYQQEKENKDIRIKQLETMFQSKDISVPLADAEALQTFLKITNVGGYIPAINRAHLHHWLDVVYRNFATRLDAEYASLTEREKDICYLTALNLPVETIAALLKVQPRSVDRYIARTCEKLRLQKKNKENFVDFIRIFALAKPNSGD